MIRASRGRSAHRRTQLRPGGEDALGHVWHTEASATRGETVQRCSRCHSLGHWPIGTMQCVPIRVHLGAAR